VEFLVSAYHYISLLSLGYPVRVTPIDVDEHRHIIGVRPGAAYRRHRRAAQARLRQADPDPGPRAPSEYEHSQPALMVQIKSQAGSAEAAVSVPSHGFLIVSELHNPSQVGLQQASASSGQ